MGDKVLLLETQCLASKDTKNEANLRLATSPYYEDIGLC